MVVNWSTTACGTPTSRAISAIRSSFMPLPCGWLANSALWNCKNLSGAWSATTAEAFAARVEYSLPFDT